MKRRDFIKRMAQIGLAVPALSTTSYFDMGRRLGRPWEGVPDFAIRDDEYAWVWMDTKVLMRTLSYQGVPIIMDGDQPKDTITTFKFVDYEPSWEW